MLETLLPKLRIKRNELGIPLEVLAKRAKLSRATVYRMLSSKPAAFNFEHAAAVAKVLGVAIQIQFQDTPSETLVEQMARKKAERLVGLVQGTMGLEAQALAQDKVEEMVEKTFRKLMQGSRKKLWA